MTAVSWSLEFLSQIHKSFPFKFISNAIFIVFCYYAEGCNLECFRESAASLHLRRYTPQGCLTSCGSTCTVAGLWALAWHRVVSGLASDGMLSLTCNVLQNFEGQDMSAWKPCSCKFGNNYSRLHSDPQANLANWQKIDLRCSMCDLQILRGATGIWQADPAAVCGYADRVPSISRSSPTDIDTQQIEYACVGLWEYC